MKIINQKPGIYRITLDAEDHKLKLITEEITMTYANRTRFSVSGLISLIFEGKRHQFLSIKKGQIIGTAELVTNEQMKNIKIEFCNYLEVKEKMKDQDKILIYPVHRTPTEKELNDVKNCPRKA